MCTFSITLGFQRRLVASLEFSPVLFLLSIDIWLTVILSLAWHDIKLNHGVEDPLPRWASEQ